ncbi:MAG: cupredoxin domain-containing protein [Minisyncoccia bacterium]
MIKKFVISAMVFSLFMFVGALQVRAEENNVSSTSNTPDKVQSATCMQDATAKQKAALNSAQDAYLSVIKNAKNRGEKYTWWPWSKARVEARKVRREITSNAKNVFEMDREACKNLSERADKGDNRDEDKNDKDDKEISLMLSSQNNSGISGVAILKEENGGVKVELKLAGSPSGVVMPSHIHIGSCPNPGAVKYPLTSVVNGKSETTLNGITFAQLKTGLPLAINVHKSQAEAGVYVACGDVVFKNTIENKVGDEKNTPTIGTREQVQIPASAVKKFTITGSNFKFEPSAFSVNKGDTVKIVFKNIDGFHDFKIDEFNVATKQSKGEDEQTVTFVADKAGSFEYYCSVGTHRAMGMKGTLTVK